AATLDRIGLQLYTVRGALERDFEGTLDRVAAIGYREVEFAGYYGKTPHEVWVALEKRGLAAPSAHVPFETLKGNWRGALEGGGDPLAYFARYPGRFPMVHVKDMDKTRQRGMTDVGRGVIDFKRIFARRAQAGIAYCFVEHDQPADPFASIRASYDYLKHLEF